MVTTRVTTMALVNKAGSLIRQTASRHINHELSSSNSSIFQIIRCVSSSKLLVAGLSHATTKTSLKKAFVPYGDVKEAQVFLKSEKASKNAGSSGFGLVVYSNTESASAAIKALDQKELHGRVVRVKYLENKTQEDRGSGEGYGSSLCWNL
ncbi:Nucleotide-binding, alpha-beta plait [Artemisia annua]|uniref:Nucleotide-binding, alpha-beta plait n=1 Tax=Artemisia annua TaxID=35608 RepID=A0A2U1N072_ARTAN|nr:Nucleotide-binding, alpha-beta plait [Artemisia annua]